MKPLIILTVLLFTLAARADWNDRATQCLKNGWFETNKIAVAVVVAKKLHPTSARAQLKSFEVKPSGKNLQVEITVAWEGISRAEYESKIAWTLNENESVSVEMLSETSAVHAAKPNLASLEKWFRLEAYPSLCSSLK